MAELKNWSSSQLADDDNFDGDIKEAQLREGEFKLLTISKEELHAPQSSVRQDGTDRKDKKEEEEEEEEEDDDDEYGGIHKEVYDDEECEVVIGFGDGVVVDVGRIGAVDGIAGVVGAGTVDSGSGALDFGKLERVGGGCGCDDGGNVVSGGYGVVDEVEARGEIDIEREFAHHLPGIARLNNGSFGSAPRRVLDKQAEWNLQWLRHPDAFCWDPLSDGFLAARQALAELIQAPDVDEVVLLENATTGAAMVAVDCMWGFVEGRYKKGDAILMFDSVYGAVRKCFQGYCIRAGAHLIEFKMPFPVESNEQILCTFEEFLQIEKSEHPTRSVRLAILDHITSMPSIILPVRELISLCRKYGVEEILVDGAHAIGSVDIDVQAINADYYMANVHKWLFAPPVVAFFHSKPQHLSRLHHPVVSHSYGTGLLNETYWVGTRDYSAFLAVPAAIRFMKDTFGDLDTYKKSNHDKVVEMGEMLARSWGTCLGAPPELFASMAMVGLPPGLNIHSQEDALKMRTRLREEFRVEVPLHYVGVATSHCNKQHLVCQEKVASYARISHQVYNKPEEYYAFRDAVNTMLGEGYWLHST